MTVARERCTHCTSPYTHTARHGCMVRHVCAAHAAGYDNTPGWTVTPLPYRINQVAATVAADREAGAKVR